MIFPRLTQVTESINKALDGFRFHEAVHSLYEFVWSEFCDWYIEMVKPRLYNEDDTSRTDALWTLRTVLVNSLKLLHPYMPFITEEIWHTDFAVSLSRMAKQD